MSEPRPALVCCGDLVADLVLAIERFPVEPKGVQRVHDLLVEPGGAGNVLITSARLGARAMAMGAMGEDAYGEHAYVALRAEGVDVSCVQRGAGSVNGLVVVLADEAGQHGFLLREGRGAPFEFGAREQATVRGADLVFIPGYAWLEPRMASAMPSILSCALEAGVPVVNDPGPIAAEPSAREMALAAIRSSALTLLTTDEALNLSGAPTEYDAAAWLLGQGARGIVVKRGAEGCAVYSPERDEPALVPGIPVPVRDTTAAGDAFDAAFCLEWLKHGDVVRAARFANLVGAAKVQKLGSGRRCPTLAEIEAMRAVWG